MYDEMTRWSYILTTQIVFMTGSHKWATLFRVPVLGSLDGTNFVIIKQFAGWWLLIKQDFYDKPQAEVFFLIFLKTPVTCTPVYSKEL